MWMIARLHRFRGPAAGGYGLTVEEAAARRQTKPLESTQPVVESFLTVKEAADRRLIVLGESIQPRMGVVGYPFVDVWAVVPGVSHCYFGMNYHRDNRAGSLASLPCLRDPQILQWEECRQLTLAARTAGSHYAGETPDYAPVGMLADWFQDHDEPEAGAYYARRYHQLLEAERIHKEEQAQKVAAILSPGRGRVVQPVNSGGMPCG